jgi:radical SAM protein
MYDLHDNLSQFRTNCRRRKLVTLGCLRDGHAHKSTVAETLVTAYIGQPGFNDDMKPADTTIDFNERPYIAIWEVTQACDLACLHCRACAQPRRHPLELTTDEGKALIDQIAAMNVPVFVLTGGDPIKRPDLFELIEYGTGIGVRVSMTPSATPLLTREIVHRLKDCGLARLAVSLDGPSREVHDAFRGMAGSFDRTMDAIEWANECALPVQINTTFSRTNHRDFDAMATLLEQKKITLWSVFFLVPTGRGKLDQLLTDDEFEEIFAKLYRLSKRARFHIKTTEAQHYRRYVLQQQVRERKTKPPAAVQASFKVADSIGRAPRGLNDGKGFVFISHLGDVCPSGFLPISGGNIRQQRLSDIYRNAPIFRQLRNPDNLGGKCGDCEFRHICGGSRARAFAVSGDPLAEEPCCVYVPKPSAHSPAARSACSYA